MNRVCILIDTSGGRASLSIETQPRHPRMTGIKDRREGGAYFVITSFW
jgi:hypothetical protein